MSLFIYFGLGAGSGTSSFGSPLEGGNWGFGLKILDRNPWRWHQKNCSFVLLFPEISDFRCLFPPWWFTRTISTLISARISQFLGPTLSFLWDNSSSLSLIAAAWAASSTHCRELEFFPPSPAAPGSVCPFFPVPQKKNLIQTILPGRADIIIRIQTKQSRLPGGGDGVFSFQRNFHGAASGSWKAQGRWLLWQVGLQPR